MRKILLMIIIMLLLVLGYVILVNGLKMGAFQILGMEEIKQTSEELTAKIEEVNSLISVNYPNKLEELKTAANKMRASKTEYIEYTNLSTDQDILNAMQEKSYAIEFLWAKIGTHARTEGINLKLEIAASSIGASGVNDLQFTLQGSYIGITNFIYAIENDTDLNFRIQNFKLLPYQEDILQGTFTVRNIAIKGNTSSQSVTATQAENTTKENTTNNNTQNTTVAQ